MAVGRLGIPWCFSNKNRRRAQEHLAGHYTLPSSRTLFIVALNLSQLCVPAPLPLTAGFVLNEPTLSLQSSHLRGEFRVSLGWLGEGLLLSNGSPGYVASGDPGIDLSKMCLIHELFFDPVSTLIVCP